MNNKTKTGSIIVKIGLLVGFVILVLVIIAIYKETNKKKQIQAVIDSLKTESERIVKSNSTMQEKIDFLCDVQKENTVEINGYFLPTSHNCGRHMMDLMCCST